jgi:hypothetical protein
MTPGEPFARLLALAAVAALCVALAAHLMALQGLDSRAIIPGVMSIHLVAMVLFAAAFFAVRRTIAKHGNSAAQSVIMRAFPVWFRVLLGMTFVYTGVNFILCIPVLSGGNPIIVDGQFALESRGATRFVTEPEYLAVRAGQMRLGSGHWMFFLLAAAGTLWFKPAPDEA